MKSYYNEGQLSCCRGREKVLIGTLFSIILKMTRFSCHRTAIARDLDSTINNAFQVCEVAVAQTRLD